MTNIDRSGSFYVEDKELLKGLKETGYILELDEIIEGASGTKYFSWYYEHNTFADNPCSLEWLKEKVEDSKKGGVEMRVCLVERRYETGTEVDSPYTNEWARPKYRVIKKMSPEDFLLLNTPHQSIIEFLHTREGLPRFEITGEELSKETIGIIDVPYSPLKGRGYLTKSGKVIYLANGSYESYSHFDADYIHFPKSVLVKLIDSTLESEKVEANISCNGQRVIHSRNHPDKDDSWANPKLNDVSLKLSLKINEKGPQLSLDYDPINI